MTTAPIQQTSHANIGWTQKLSFVGLIFLSTALASNFVFQENFAISVEPSLIAPVTVEVPSREPTDPTAEVVANEPVSDSENQPTEDLPVGYAGEITNEDLQAAKHPLDPVMVVAHKAIKHIEETVQDYTATIVKQVRVNDRLGKEQYMQIKVRHEVKDGDSVVSPFAVYTKFLKPRSVAGQEAIWVSGENNDNICCHPAGFLNVVRLNLSPESPIAMRGNRYSIRNIGMKNLVKKMIELGDAVRPFGNCEARIERNVKVGKMVCSMLEVIHPKQLPKFEFHKARIYIEDKRGLPVAYEGYLWPKEDSEELPLLERYYYTNIKLNVGLTDKDFDPDSDEYNYPKK